MATDSVCFNCLGEVNPEDLTLNRVQDLNKLLRNKIDLVSPTTAFGYDFVDEASFLNNLETLFQMAKQRFARLERVVNSSANDTFFVQDETSMEFFELRLEICEFLKRVLHFTRSKSSEINYESITAQVVNFLLRLGHISNLPNHVTSRLASVQGNRCTSCIYHLLHVHLDVKWYVLLLLRELQENSFDDHEKIAGNLWSTICERYAAVSDSSKPVDQYAGMVLWDLMSLAVGTFTKITMKDYFITSPFPCTCCRDLWILVIQFLDAGMMDGGDSFWVTLHGMLHIILGERNAATRSEDSKNLSSDLKVIPDISNLNHLGFGWYLMLHVSPLYRVDSSGEPRSFQQTMFHGRSNYFELVNLLKLTICLEGNGRSERQMRSYLRCCLSICEDWEASTEAPLLLWEHFFKKLNDLFMDDGEVTTTCISGKSALDWMKSVKYVIDDGDRDAAANLNSFQLFLRLVALQLKKSARSRSGKEWRQLKGRIFSKFHPRRIQELNLNGLHNCFCLFLTLASVADLGDVVGKVCDLLEMMNPSMCEHNKHCVIWRAMFALMLICEERNQDLALPAQKMAHDFNDLARVADNRQDTVLSHMATELFNIYLEGVQDIFEHSSTLSLSEYILIATGFSDLLSHGSTSDLQMALAALQVVLARHRMLCRCASNSCGETSGGSGGCALHDQHDAIGDALWEYVYPIVREKALGDSPPLGILADVVAGLSLLAIDMPPKLLPAGLAGGVSLSVLLDQFCFGLNCHPEFCSRYLSQCLAERRLVDRMARDYADCHVHLVRVWVRLGVQLSAATRSTYQEVTRFILKLPETGNLFDEVGHAVPVPNAAFVAFLQALDACHSNGSSQGISFRQKVSVYMADVACVVDSALKRCVADEVSHLYYAVGQVVKHVGGLIYVRSKPDCLLNHIVGAMLLPPSVYSQECSVPSYQLTALKETVPMYVEGLLKVGCRRDPYIGRVVRELFVHYLLWYPLKSASCPATPVHPLVTSLVGFMRSYPSNSEPFCFVLGAVRDHYLGRKGSQLHTGVRFIGEVLLRSTARQRGDCCATLVPSLLRSLLFVDDGGLKQEILDLVKVMAGAVHGTRDGNVQRFSMTGAMEDLFKQQFSVHTERCLKLLEFLSESFADVLGGLVPTLAHQLNAVEMQRGAGCDEAMRVRYRQFLTNLHSILEQRRRALEEHF